MLTYIIHVLAKEYGYSKSDIDELYPDEVKVLMDFIRQDKENEKIQEAIRDKLNALNVLYVYHADPITVEKELKKELNNLSTSIVITEKSTNIQEEEILDDDLPDFESMSKLRQFKSEHPMIGR